MVITVSQNTGEIIKHCIEVLERILGDDSVPRNIRRSADIIKNVLSNEKEPLSKRASLVISTLDDMGNDPNIPIHTRTLIWGLSSKLESIPLDK